MLAKKIFSSVVGTVFLLSLSAPAFSQANPPRMCGANSTDGCIQEGANCTTQGGAAGKCKITNNQTFDCVCDPIIIINPRQFDELPQTENNQSTQSTNESTDEGLFFGN